MNYHIIVLFAANESKKKRIASFTEEQDRNICFDAFVEYWGEDCEFEKEDD